jgi:hypothetical protein
MEAAAKAMAVSARVVDFFMEIFLCLTKRGAA